MIIFTGTGRNGTGMYAKMFDAHHEYNMAGLVEMIKEKVVNWSDPETDYLSDPADRKDIMARHLKDVDINDFRDSSNPYIHFLDTLYEMDPAIRIVLGLRDGRDFARSGLSRGYHTSVYNYYGMIPERDTPFYREWPTMNPIEKMAWLWSYRNHKALTRLQSVPKQNYWIVRLEDLVADDEKAEQTIAELENFVGIKMDRQWLTTKYNKNIAYVMPSKEQWTPDMNTSFFRIAGAMMRRFGYV
jgi:hypothetical protein